MPNFVHIIWFRDFETNFCCFILLCRCNCFTKIVFTFWWKYGFQTSQSYFQTCPQRNNMGHTSTVLSLQILLTQNWQKTCTVIQNSKILLKKTDHLLFNNFFPSGFMGPGLELILLGCRVQAVSIRWVKRLDRRRVSVTPYYCEHTMLLYTYWRVVGDNDMILPQSYSSKSYLLKTEGFLSKFSDSSLYKNSCRNTDYVAIYVRRMYCAYQIPCNAVFFIFLFNYCLFFRCPLSLSWMVISTFSYQGIVIHELMHILSASHEMQRPDRNMSIKTEVSLKLIFILTDVKKKF